MTTKITKDLTIIEATKGQFDTTGEDWTTRKFSYPERTIRVATSFSGIGAPETALERLGLKTKIVFACDIGERYLKYSYRQLSKFTEGLDEEKRKLFACYLYEQNRANIETLRENQANEGKAVKPFTLDEVMSNLYEGVTDPNVKLELVKECIEMLTEGMTSEERETYVNGLYEEKGNNDIKDAFFANHDIKEQNWHTDIRFMDATKYKGQVDLYVGGSPCQSYSRSGKRLGLEDTRGTLFYEFAKRIEECEPKVFIYENVKGMLSAGNGEMSGLEAALEVFNGLGYRIFWNVLNSKNYGIPQNRERVWVVGFKEDREFLFPKAIPLTTVGKDYLDTPLNSDLPYIRNLSGKENLRLMGFNDFNVPESVLELSECGIERKLRAFAGNSMVVECLMALFKQMDITQYGEEEEKINKDCILDDAALDRLTFDELFDLAGKVNVFAQKVYSLMEKKRHIDTPVAKEDKVPVSDAKDFVAKVDKKEISSKSKRGYRQKVVRYKDGLLVEEEPFESIMDAERRTGVNHSNITSCIKGRTKSAGGYEWRKLEEVSVSEPPVVSVEDAAVSMIETTPDTQCIEKEKLSVSNEAVGEMIVAYYLDKNKEIDRTLGPIGTFKSQKEVADRFGVKKSTISNYFRGEKKSIRWTNEEGKKVKVGFVKEAA